MQVWGLGGLCWAAAIDAAKPFDHRIDHRCSSTARLVTPPTPTAYPQAKGVADLHCYTNTSTT
jgi:hypothetical protein